MKPSSPLLLLSLGFLVSGCSDETILRSDKPLTRAAATRELIDFPFPASAHSIHYLMQSGGWQDLEAYVRFDVDPRDLDSSVDALVVWNNRQMTRTLTYPRVPLSAADMPTPRRAFLPMPWWDPETIATGYYKGHLDGYALRIIADQARSRIYVYQND
tara:strand:+ start:98 stop:571 length:474 start_codon:yes stop_codon:yes gene_type:complete